MTKEDNDKNISEIWALFHETDTRFKETAARFKGTDEKFKEIAARFKGTDAKFKEIAASFKETDAKFKEIAARFKETDAKFKETDAKFKETDAKFKETDARLDKIFKETAVSSKETDKKIKELADLFTGQWGKLIESLAESGIIEQLQSRGIKVTNLARRLTSHKNGHHLELDFLLSNESELTIGEVKTTMRVSDVENFLQKLSEFLLFYPYYKGFKIYGAMIGVRIEQEADKFAYRNGLFVFQVGGEGMLKLLNDEDFQPKDFSLKSGV